MTTLIPFIQVFKFLYTILVVQDKKKLVGFRINAILTKGFGQPKQVDKGIILVLAVHQASMIYAVEFRMGMGIGSVLKI